MLKAEPEVPAPDPAADLQAFTGIAPVIEETLARVAGVSGETLERMMQADAQARRVAAAQAERRGMGRAA